MASLRSLFSNLESCTFVVRLAHNYTTGLPFRTGISGHPGLLDTVLGYCDMKSINKPVAMRETFVEFIDAFLERGPGKRKFIRFAHTDYYGKSWKRVGKLVRVSSKQEPTTLPLDSSVLGNHQFATDAEQIFQKAYWGPYLSQ